MGVLYVHTTHLMLRITQIDAICHSLQVFRCLSHVTENSSEYEPLCRNRTCEPTGGRCGKCKAHVQSPRGYCRSSSIEGSYVAFNIASGLVLHCFVPANQQIAVIKTFELKWCLGQKPEKDRPGLLSKVEHFFELALQ